MKMDTFSEGAHARHQGKRSIDNPYSRDTAEHYAWLRGFNCATFPS